MTAQVFINQCIDYFGDWNHISKRASIYSFVKEHYSENDFEVVFLELKKSCSKPPDIHDIVKILEPADIGKPKPRKIECDLPPELMGTFINPTAQEWYDTELKPFFEEQPYDKKTRSFLTDDEEAQMKQRAQLFFETLYKLMKRKLRGA